MAEEKPFFLDTGRYRLFCVLHEPAPEAARRPAFVFCSPFAEEKLWSHRVFVTFARALAQRGHAVLRFDYMGNGDSDGAFEESSAETNLSDIKAAAGHLKSIDGAGEGVYLLGLCLGATFASIAAEEISDVTGLVLWNPVVDGAAYMQEMLKINLSTQMSVYKEIRQTRVDLGEELKRGQTVNVDGYEMSRALFEQVSAIDLASTPKSFSGRVLVADINRKGEPGKASAALASTYNDCTVSAVKEELFWKEIRAYYPRAENLFAATLAWLGEK